MYNDNVLNDCVIYDKKDNKYLCLMGKYNKNDFNELYNENYDERPINYYDPNVLKVRKEYTLKFINNDISKYCDIGYGKNPWWKDLLVKPYHWDKYLSSSPIFDYNKFLNCSSVSFYDVAEHFWDIKQTLMFSHFSTMILTMPIFPGIINSIDDIKNWNHFKPREHTVYTNKEGFYDIIDEINAGWKIKYFDYPECNHPCKRKDIATILLQRE